MPFAATFTRASTSQPGVSFVVRRMGFARRTDLDFETLKWRQRLRELEGDLPQASNEEKEAGVYYMIALRKSTALIKLAGTEPVDEDLIGSAVAETAKLKDELDATIPLPIKTRRNVIFEEIQGVSNRIQAKWITEGLVSIHGGEFDGMTPAELLDFGPQELAGEIYQALIFDGKLDGAGKKTLSSPMPSGEAEDGPKTNTTAPSAAVPQGAGISTETVSAIS